MEVKPFSKWHLFHSKFDLSVLQRRIYSNQSDVRTFKWIIAKVLYLSGVSRTFVGVVVVIVGVCGF